MDENNNPIQETGANQNPAGNNGVKKVNTMALLSFIFSLVGLIVAGLPCGIVAVITGIVGLVKFKPETEKCKWMAIVGIILGAIDVVAVVINIIMKASVLL